MVADTVFVDFVDSVDCKSIQLGYKVANLPGLVVVLTVRILDTGFDIPEVVESVQNTVADLGQDTAAAAVDSRQCRPVVVVVVVAAVAVVEDQY